MNFFYRFCSETKGSILEYLILLSVIAVVAASTFPGLRHQLAEWSGDLTNNLSSSIGSQGATPTGAVTTTEPPPPPPPPPPQPPTDTLPPSEATNPLIESITPDSVKIVWNASVSSDIKEYHVYKGGNLVSTTSGHTASLVGLSPSTSHEVVIKAVDQNGNTSTGVSVLFQTKGPYHFTGIGKSVPSEYAASTNIAYATVGSQVRFSQPVVLKSVSIYTTNPPGTLKMGIWDAYTVLMDSSAFSTTGSLSGFSVLTFSFSPVFLEANKFYHIGVGGVNDLRHLPSSPAVTNTYADGTLVITENQGLMTNQFDPAPTFKFMAPTYQADYGVKFFLEYSK